MVISLHVFAKKTMTYAGLHNVQSEVNSHLGGNVSVGDPFTYSPSVWNYLLSRFCIKSVLDLGSGIGNASRYFCSKGVDVIAIDAKGVNNYNELWAAKQIYS